jgi:hypothetical protein
VRIRRVIVNLRKAQSDRVDGAESKFAELTKPTKLDREYLYHHGTTQDRSVEPDLQITSKQPHGTSTATRK